MRWTMSVASALLLVAGCKDPDDGGSTDPDGDDVAVIENGADGVSVETDAQLVASSLVSASSGALRLASTDLAGVYFPRACVAVESDDANARVVYRFDRCTGPNGLRGVSGAVTAQYRVSAGQLRLELTATDLVVNRATVDLSASVTVTEEADGARAMQWQAQVAGETARGRAFARSNDHTVRWKLGDSCFALDGVSEGEIAKKQVRMEIQNFRRCRRSCPDADGKIVITDVTRSRTVELRYEGTSNATFVDAKGRTSSLPLLCAQ